MDHRDPPTVLEVTENAREPLLGQISAEQMADLGLSFGTECERLNDALRDGIELGSAKDVTGRIKGEAPEVRAASRCCSSIRSLPSNKAKVMANRSACASAREVTAPKMPG